MITKIRQVLHDTWPFFVAAGITLAILLAVADVSQQHREYRYRVEYSLGRHRMINWVDWIETRPASVVFVDTDGDTVEVKGSYLIIKQNKQ